MASYDRLFQGGHFGVEGSEFGVVGRIESLEALGILLLQIAIDR